MNQDQVPLEIQQLADQAEDKLIPAKSRDAYVKEYNKLMTWMKHKKCTTVNESLMLAYMMEMSNVYKSSSMWCIHSKLQAMLRLKQGVDLASYHKLHAFMKATNKGYEAKKSYTFTEEELRKFFVEAPDNTFLFLKAVAICGVFGTCRRSEMCDLRLTDIKREGVVFFINIRPGKTERGRKFAIMDCPDIPYATIFHKYLSLRPKDVATDRVFLKYADGKCFRQVVGINTFGSCPSRIARYLNLSEPEKYTGHAFRRTSATIMANSGMSLDELKRQVGWKSSSVASGYIEDSNVNKVTVSKRIAESVTSGQMLQPSSSTTSTVSTSIDTINKTVCKSMKSADGFNISNNSNCTFNLYFGNPVE